MAEELGTGVTGFAVGDEVIGFTNERVIGLASEQHHAWLAEHGAIPVTYGEGMTTRVQAASEGRVNALIDTFGQPYIELALALGVPRDRINTIIDFAGAEKYGTRVEGSMAAASADVLGELARLIAAGDLEIPIAKVYPLDEVRDAYQELEHRHTIGKIVLKP